MKKRSANKKKSGIVIVAHPDDETIWMGGYILSHPEVDWTIFVLCRASDADRAPKFQRVVAAYKAHGIIADLNDEGDLSLKEAANEAAEIIRSEIAGSSYDLLFTHGANGEYGHYLHKAVNKAVQSCLKNKVFKAKKAFCFNYRKSGRNKVPSMIKRIDSDLICQLDTEFTKKRNIMTDIYGFLADGIDTNFCTNPEAFKYLA